MTEEILKDEEEKEEITPESQTEPKVDAVAKPMPMKLNNTTKNIVVPQHHNSYIQNLLLERIQSLGSNSPELAIAKAAFDTIRLA